MKVNIDLTKTNVDNQVADELLTDVGAGAFNLYHDFFYGSTDVEIWTAAGGTGTQLVEDTDYTLGDINTDLTTRAGVDIFGSITVINVTYQTGDLYFTYHACADHVDADDRYRVERTAGGAETVFEIKDDGAFNVSRDGTDRMQMWANGIIIFYGDSLLGLDAGSGASTVTLGSGNVSIGANGTSVVSGNTKAELSSSAGTTVIRAGTDLTLRDGNTSTDIPFSETGVTGLEGFTATSVIGALNEAATLGGGGSEITEAIETPTSFVGNGNTWSASTLPTGSLPWDTLAYGNGTFIVVGEDGSNNIARSTDNGQTWELATSGSSGSYYVSAYGNGTWLAMGYSTYNSISTDDGVTWTNVTKDPSITISQWYSLAYGDGTFVAASLIGTDRIMYSDDLGQSWTQVSPPADESFRGVAYGGGVFIIVSQGGTNRVLRSTDNGQSWTGISADTGSWNAVTYGDGVFVAVAGGTTDTTMWSDDGGLTWNAVDAAASATWNSVAYSGGVFTATSSTTAMYSDDFGQSWTQSATLPSSGYLSVAGSQSGFVSTGTGSAAMFSLSDAKVSSAKDLLFEDATTSETTLTDLATLSGVKKGDVSTGQWELIDAAHEDDYYGIAFGDGVFVAVTSTNEILRSTDAGETWAFVTIPEANAWSSVTFGDGIFVAVATTGTNRIMRSDDLGASWTAIAAPYAYEWESITFGNGTFVAVSNGGTYRAISSEDGGVTWAGNESDGTTQNGAWLSVAYGDGYFVAVDTDNAIMRSTNGFDWDPPSTYYWGSNFTSIAYGEGRWVTAGEEMAESTDNGDTWSSMAYTPSSDTNGLRYLNGIFIAPLENSTNLLISADGGVTWSETDVLGVAQRWQDIAFGDGAFVTVADSLTNQLARQLAAVKLSTPGDLILEADDDNSGKTVVLGNFVMPTSAPSNPVNGSVYIEYSGPSVYLYVWSETQGDWGWVDFTFNM